ncbi:hypothetical protein GCM10011344_34410 [Dokdonia pacifica]|uniref:Acyl-CoA-binding protein n=1 Tax=Dokdonia pacifica TaxID=1627892 RepID=A0A239BAF8_9FLAO|nr:acyl-CoA-binding protein [Dokdonia pacifica]GGG30571.1 hypothetical protein GCM10011344_34410 [Dokdonia pacifica]SNS04531.1 Acyl-CoA-binding protein [Dokdonia pacifica]
MEKEALHTAFWEAFRKVGEAKQAFPPDVLLRFYALYKQATQENTFSYQKGEHELVSAFKMNALLQVKSMTSDEAKLAYIEQANKYVK